MSGNDKKTISQMSEQEKQWTPLPNEASPERYKHIALKAACKAVSEIKGSKRRR